MKSPETQEYITALEEIHTNRGICDTSRGRHGGTWAHPKLAVFFARWLDVKFSVWCDAVISDILSGAAEVTITKPQESAVMALPLEYAATARTLTYMDELSKGGKIPQLKEASRGRYGCIWTTQITGFR